MELQPVPKPGHVSPDRVLDIDIYNLPGGSEDVHAAWKSLQDDREVVWTPRNGGHWIAISGKMVEAFYKRNDLFSSRVAAVPAGTTLLPLFPLEADGEIHTEFRNIIMPVFQPSELARFTVTARSLSIELIEGFKDRGHCEFNADFALVLPLTIFLSIVDLPHEDRHFLHPHIETGLRSGDPEKRIAAHQAIYGYITGWLEKRRANPGDDLLTRIVQARPFGRPITEQEAIGVAMLMLFGGLDTVTSMMGFVMHFLAEHPDHRRSLVNRPENAPRAIEEIMRRYGVGLNTRTAIEDTDIGGVTIRSGEQVVIPNCLHGLDEREFDDPLTVDFTRPGKWSATFGAGPHKCPGMNLARMEIRVLVDEWLARIPDFEIVPGSRLVYGSGAVNGLLGLPLRWQVPGNH